MFLKFRNIWYHVDVMTWKRLPHYCSLTGRGISNIVFPSKQPAMPRFKATGVLNQQWNYFMILYIHICSQVQLIVDNMITSSNEPFQRGIHQSRMNSSHKGQWGGAMMVSLICAYINCWVNNREAGDLRRHRAHYDVIVMKLALSTRQDITCRTDGQKMCIYDTGRQSDNVRPRGSSQRTPCQLWEKIKLSKCAVCSIPGGPMIYWNGLSLAFLLTGPTL